MSLRLKSIPTVSVVLIALVTVLSLTLSAVMMAGFRKVEEEDARQNVTRVIDAVAAQLQGIENTLFTWTQWDPAYRFMADHDPAFLQENISSTLYTGMKINFCIFVDPSGAVPFAGGYDLAAGRDLPVPPELLGMLRPGSTLLRNSDPSRSVRGLVKLGDSALLIAATPVTNTAGTAPARGHIVFARFFDGVVRRALAETTHLGVAVDRDLEPGDLIRISPLNGEVIQGVANLQDVDQRPILRLTVSIPRAIHRQATRSLWSLIVSIIGIGGAFGAVTLVVIRVRILRRLLYLSEVVSQMTESLDFSRRLEVQGDDEIAGLMTSINGMACAMSEILSTTNRLD